ncbi:UDP-3-O-[3-hydroxymyristoyl] N-acetylglucosamine deacetylase [Cyanobacterium sp. HL-69]|uniref:UDP-3-O-acyl-N-acetylglucosamine deacetylase n=1 Tax=Cyanobacterium sp. HL-69 TaxID=2054282 RepID=UPI000CA3B857|nr:UDP-3-O-[3-hydroxymyristoyl] N-acetylglucosamine deacetylase [Cyanobacterium sp. HL-69]
MFKSFQLTGVGLHSGKVSTVKLFPEEKGKGRYFVRVDLPDSPSIPATIDSVDSTLLSTELAVGEAKVRTVEHLLSSLCACGIDDVRMEIDGAEVPLMDGSGQLWCDRLYQPNYNFSESKYTIKEPIWIRHKDAFVAALPSDKMVFTYGVDFPYKAIQNQWFTWYPERETFPSAIAPARTFGFAEQIEYLQSQGLIKGGNLSNALVCSHDGWVNPPLRFDNEPVRHKILDLVGDLSLLGTIPTAHYLAYKASHQLHTQLARQIQAHNR